MYKAYVDDLVKMVREVYEKSKNGPVNFLELHVMAKPKRHQSYSEMNWNRGNTYRNQEFIKNRMHVNEKFFWSAFDAVVNDPDYLALVDGFDRDVLSQFKTNFLYVRVEYCEGPGLPFRSQTMAFIGVKDRNEAITLRVTGDIETVGPEQRPYSRGKFHEWKERAWEDKFVNADYS